MKYILIVLLALTANLSAQSYDWEKWGEPVSSTRNYYKENTSGWIEDTDPFDLNHYFHLFRQLSANGNITTKGYEAHTMLKHGYWGQYIEFRFGVLEDRIIAKAHSPKKGDDIIVVDADKWLKLTPYERIWLIAHEYYHEVYGLRHGEGGSLMFPILKKLPVNKDSADELVQALINMRYYVTFEFKRTHWTKKNDGTLQIFTDITIIRKIK